MCENIKKKIYFLTNVFQGKISRYLLRIVILTINSFNTVLIFQMQLYILSSL